MCYPALEHLLCLAARNSWESSRKYNSAWCCTSSTNPLRPLMQLTIGRFCDINCAVTPNSFALRVISDILWRSSYESFWILETLEIFLWFTINYSWNWSWEWLCFDQSCVNWTESVHGTLRLFPVFISPIVRNIVWTSSNVMNRYISKSYTRSKNTVYTIYRVRAAHVVSTITSLNNLAALILTVSFCPIHTENTLRKNLFLNLA